MSPRTIPLTLFSKSHAESAWRCERQEYWAYLWGMTGLSPTAAAFDLEYGKIIHEACEMLAIGKSMTRAPAKLAGDALQLLTKATLNAEGLMVAPRVSFSPFLAKQWASIAEGSVAAYAAHRWPLISDEYDVIDCERPLVYPIDQVHGMWFVSIPDLILRSKLTHELWYWERKTTGSYLDARFLNSFNTAVQIHTGIKAAERYYGEPFAGCIVECWFKGKKDNYTLDKQASPFAWGHVHRGRPGVMPDQWLYERPKQWKGWEGFCVPEEWDPSEWAVRMPSEVLNKQFATTPPILVREDIVEDFIEQTRFKAARIIEARKQLAATATLAGRIEHGLQAVGAPDISQAIHRILNEFFPQSFDQCEPAYGFKCWARELCWVPWINADPLGSQLFVRNSRGQSGIDWERIIAEDESREAQ